MNPFGPFYDRGFAHAMPQTTNAPSHAAMPHAYLPPFLMMTQAPRKRKGLPIVDPYTQEMVAIPASRFSDPQSPAPAPAAEMSNGLPTSVQELQEYDEDAAEATAASFAAATASSLLGVEETQNGEVRLLEAESAARTTLEALRLTGARDGLAAIMDVVVQLVFAEKAAVDRQASESAAEAVQLREEHDQLKACQEAELRRLSAESAAADRRATVSAAEALRLRGEHDQLETVHNAAMEVVLAEVVQLKEERDRLKAGQERAESELDRWEQALRPSEEVISQMGQRDLEQLLLRMGRARNEVKHIKVQQLVCVVCFEHAKEIVFVPCRHQCTCPPCAGLVAECPMCRSPIVDRIQPF